MRILAFEYITGGGMLNESLPEGLAAEGDLMLRALVDDLAAIPSVETVVTRDARLPSPGASMEELRLGPDDDFETVWRSLLRGVDAVWPVAPETGGCLERLCRDVLEAGRILLNSAPDGVNTAASKRRTLARLAGHGIPVVPAYCAQDAIPDDASTWVVKPDDGAGCEGIRLFDSLEQARQAAGDALIQPFIDGIDLSLSLICHRGTAKLLSVNRQHILRVGNTLKLDGCIVDIASDYRLPFSSLASDIARAVPGLWGYAGVDLMLCDEGLKVLEINPRLTTSYATLPRMRGANPAQQVLNLLGRDTGVSAG